MSTTFGIPRKVVIEPILDDECLPEGYIESDFIPVAFQGNDGNFRWLIEFADVMRDDVKIFPLDNSAQGIFTIGDVRKEINND